LTDILTDVLTDGLFFAGMLRSESNFKVISSSPFSATESTELTAWRLATATATNRLTFKHDAIVLLQQQLRETHSNKSATCKK
jgi:hypothetical protein